MKKRLFIFLAMAISAVALGFLSPLTSSSSVSAQEQGGDTSVSAQGQGGDRRHVFHETLVLDVAVDGRTFDVNGGRKLMDAKRGDGFIVKGKIYPGGTITPGCTIENPGPFNPDTEPGSIGAWICRGTFEFDFSQILAGFEPHVFSTQYYLLNDGRGLVSDGPEGGLQVRSLIGGMGAFAGAIAEVFEEPIGVNSSGLFNHRFTFKFKKRADK